MYERCGAKAFKIHALDDNPRCHYCNMLLTSDTATVDHVIPRKLGGSSVWSNLVLSCGKCNVEKGHSISDYDKAFLRSNRQRCKQPITKGIEEQIRDGRLQFVKRLSKRATLWQASVESRPVLFKYDSKRKLLSEWRGEQ
jgi:hypothetical protein